MSSDAKQFTIRSDKLGRAHCHHCNTLLDVSDFHVFEVIECPECSKTTTVPGQFGDYVLMYELGRGGMGAVFLARDTRLGRKVALKILNSVYGQNPEFIDSLLQEAKATAALNHQNIVHIFSFGQVYQQPYFVMELVEGIRLDQCIGAKVDPDEAGWLELMAQVVDGLANAQTHGLIHGDVKPANMLMDQRGVVKISDFGIARFGESGPTDTIFGTPMYIAPEKARGKAYDHRSDQYSLGTSFWHLITGRPPFIGKTSREVVFNRFEKTPPDLREFLPDLSGAFSDLIRKTMALNPEERFEDFFALKAEIERVQASKQAEAFAQVTLEDTPVQAYTTQPLVSEDEKTSVPAPQGNRRDNMMLQLLWGLVGLGFTVILVMLIL
jgi:serine/threonine protein kinase